MTKGLPATLQNKWLFCWVGELESHYRQLKYKKLTKIELQTEQRRLNEKLKNFDNEDYQTVSSFSEENHDEDDPELIPPTSQVTNAMRKLYVENKTKNSKKKKIHKSSNKNEVMDKSEPEETSNQEENVNRKKHKKADKEEESSDDSDIESQCSFDQHLKFDKSYLPGHQFNYTFINKDLIENLKTCFKEKGKTLLKCNKNIIN